MFWKRKTNVIQPNEIIKEPILSTKEPILSTIDIVRKNSLSLVDFSDEKMEHLYTHAKIVGQDAVDPIGYFDEELRNELFDNDFLMIVKHDFVEKFKYHADLAEISVLSSVYEDSSHRYASQVKYIGDIPNSVIERIKEAKRYLRCFTIHSNQPLLVKRMALVDPVVIGWLDNPAIHVKSDATLKHVSQYCLGIVIAVWDYDKEFNLEAK